MDTLPVLQDLVICRQVSTYDRKGGNDNGFTNKAEWVRRERGSRVVILDAAGPGEVRNLVLSWLNHPKVPKVIERRWARFVGDIKFFFDGATTPAIAEPVSKLIGSPPHTFPVAVTADESTGAYVSYVPIPFQDGLRITVDGGAIPMFFYRIWYHCHPFGSDVAKLTDQDTGRFTERFDAEVAWECAGRVGEELVDFAVAAGDSREIFTSGSAGTIGCIRMRLPEDDVTLRNLWLRAWWDDDDEPSVDVPLSLLFAVENRFSQKAAAVVDNAEMGGSVVGQDPEGFFFLRLPMPFARRARLVVENRGRHDATIEAIRVEIAGDATSGVGTSAGYLRTQFRESNALTPGRDYVLAHVHGRGHIVGTVLAVEDTAETFLEGDERICVDGCRTPLVIGDATETYFNGAWYFWDRAFACPVHGAPTFRLESKSVGSRADVTMYRFHVTDWIPYRSEARFSIQHGPFNDVPGNYRSVVFYYGLDEGILALSDSIDLASPGALDAHEFAGAPSMTQERSGFFTGDRNGQDLGLRRRPEWLPAPLFMLYLTIRGVFHDPPGDSPDRVDFTVSTCRDPHAFKVQVDPAASAVMVRRVFDQSVPDQRARIEVDGVTAGIWFNAGRNKWKIFAEDDLILDPATTAGKNEIRIRVVPESDEFTACEYSVHSIA